MSRKLVHEEPVMNNATVASSDGSASDTGYDHFKADSESESLEISGDESRLKKESGDLFRSDKSDIETTTSDPFGNSEALGVDSSFEKGSVEDVFEDEKEQDESGNESSYISNEYQNIDDSIETSLSPTTDLKAYSTFIIKKKFVTDESEGEIEHDETENEFKSFGNAGTDTFIIKSSTKALEIDSDASSLLKKSVGDISYDDGTGDDFESNGNIEDIVTIKSSAEALEVDSNASSLLKESVGDVSNKGEHDGTGNEFSTLGNIEDTVTKSSTKLLKMDSDVPISYKKSVVDVSDDESEHEGIGNESKSSSDAKQGTTAAPKSPQSPTEALKALSISDSNSSAKKNTQRQSRFRAKTINNIFDSPYNTRLKARLIRERELRSRNEGGSSEE